MQAKDGAKDPSAVVGELLTRGYATFAAQSELQRASQTALETGRRVLSRQEFKDQLGAWSGQGMWVGYQPLPDGDPKKIDLVERFELPAAALKAAPHRSTPHGELHAALRSVHDRSIDLIDQLIAMIAAERGHAEGETRSLWIEGHESTTVVNHYPAVSLDPIAMKAHQDFGGLTLIFFEDGTAGSLDFRDGKEWQGVPNEASACAVVGELLAGWMGGTAPLHRVRSTSVPRTSLVVFHQPALDRDVRFVNGSVVNAGRHISARQAEYNVLDQRYR